MATTSTSGRPGRERERWVVDTFVELASILVGDFDLFELLALLSARCVELLGAAEAGLLLAGDDGALHVVASSSEEMHRLELFEVQRAEGPCLEVYRRGEAVLNEPLAGSTRWPRFSAQATAAGFQTVHAFPLRHKDQVIGVLNVFDHRTAALSPTDAAVTQALADIASFAILQHRALRHATELSDQLRHALASRVVIEQAKGALAERLRIDVASAFFLLRKYARNRNERIADVALQVVARELRAEDVLAGAGARRDRTPQEPRPQDGGTA